ncbi:MAG: hypothetical protein ACK4UO_00935 [Pseudolabrys sp.]
MINPFRGSIALALAAALTVGALPLGVPQASAAPKKPEAAAVGTIDLSARKRHYHRRGNSRAAMQMFGMVLGTIGAIAAAEEARRYRHRFYGHYGYGYPPPPRYYGYGPSYRY